MKYVFLFLALSCTQSQTRQLAQDRPVLPVIADEENLARCEAINTLAPVTCPLAIKKQCQGCLEEISAQARSMGANSLYLGSQLITSCAQESFSVLLFNCSPRDP